MSGDLPVVHLAGDEMARLFAAVPEIEERTGHPLVVIGGLAVLCRLGRAYRATNDLDTVHRRVVGQPPVLEVLRAAGADDGPVGVALPTPRGDVHVDVIEVDDPGHVTDPADPNDRLFHHAHHWALTTATLVTVEVVAEPHVRVVTRIAEPGPLVATKLQSAMNRATEKQRTDLLDIVSLVTDADAGQVARNQLAMVYPALAADAEQHVRHWFVDRADDSYRQLRMRSPELDRDTVALVADVLLGALRR